MKRRKLMTAFICAVCLAAVPMAGCGEKKEAEEKTAATEAEAAEETEAAEEAEEAEATEESEAGAADGTSEEAESVLTQERPLYTASEYVELGEYKGIAVEVVRDEVTDEEVDARFEMNVGNFGTKVMDVLTEGTVEEGDIANIDYVGKKDDVAFDGGTAEGYDLTIGSGQFIDGFEEGLVGAEIGSTVDLNLTFPENYQATELAGAEVVFTVTVNEVKRQPEEITDETISKGTDGKYTTIDAYKEYVRSILEDDAAAARETAILTEVVNQLCTSSKVNGYPEELVEYCKASMVEYFTQSAAMYGMELEDFVSQAMTVTMDEFYEQIQIAVESSLVQEMCLAAVGEAEGMELTEEEYKEGVANYMAMYGMTNEEEFLTTVGGENVVRLNLMQTKVKDFLIENAVVTEVEEVAEEEADAETSVEEEAETTEEEAEAETAEEAAEEEAEAETAEETAEEK